MIVAGNWKMFAGPDPAALAQRVAGIDGVEVIVCPPYVPTRSVEAGLTTYAQNVHWENEGAFTGEIRRRCCSRWRRRSARGALRAAPVLRADVARRTKAALAAARGDRLRRRDPEQRDADDTETVLRIRSTRPRRVRPHQQPHAYEPVWAIGTDYRDPELAEEAHALIKSLLDVPCSTAARSSPTTRPS